MKTGVYDRETSNMSGMSLASVGLRVTSSQPLTPLNISRTHAAFEKEEYMSYFDPNLVPGHDSDAPAGAGFDVLSAMTNTTISTVPSASLKSERQVDETARGISDPVIGRNWMQQCAATSVRGSNKVRNVL